MIQAYNIGRWDGSTLCCIAAMPFSLEGSLGPAVTIYCDWEDGLYQGLSKDSESVAWWRSQPDNVRRDILYNKESVSVEDALIALRLLIESVRDEKDEPTIERVWCMPGPEMAGSFNLSSLRYLYDFFSDNSQLLHCPWRKGNERDVVTYMQAVDPYYTKTIRNTIPRELEMPEKHITTIVNMLISAHKNRV